MRSPSEYHSSKEVYNAINKDFRNWKKKLRRYLARVTWLLYWSCEYEKNDINYFLASRNIIINYHGIKDLPQELIEGVLNVVEGMEILIDKTENVIEQLRWLNEV